MQAFEVVDMVVCGRLSATPFSDSLLSTPGRCDYMLLGVAFDVTYLTQTSNKQVLMGVAIRCASPSMAGTSRRTRRPCDGCARSEHSGEALVAGDGDFCC